MFYRYMFFSGSSHTFSVSVAMDVYGSRSLQNHVEMILILAGPNFENHMSQGRSTPCIGDGHPTFNEGILISWVYKPLVLG